MNRIFHARIALGQYLFLFLVAGMTVWALWEKHILVAIVMAAILIVGIEKLIHTTYTITSDGNLVVEQVYGIRLFGVGLMRCVLVHHGNKTEALMPVKEEEFIDVINKKRMK